MLRMGESSPLKEEDFLKISSAAILSAGDKDLMVSVIETGEISNLLKNSKLMVLRIFLIPLKK